MQIADRNYFASTPPPMGLVCERMPVPARSGRVEPRRWDAAAMLVPFEAATVRVEVAGTQPVTLDKASLLFVPRATPYRVTSTSALPHLITLLVHDELRAEAVSEYGREIDGARFDALVHAPAVLPRTTWINELCHRYVFERTHCDKHSSRAARFAELELTKELYFALGEIAAHVERASVLDGASTLTDRATAFLERNLFVPVDLEALARECGASRSTILRALKRDLGQSPSTYLRRRRLDEAMLLLKSGRLGVGEVASLVGYQSVASFTHAFHRQFGQSPSAARAGLARG